MSVSESDGADQLFLETTRRLAPPRLAMLDVQAALGLLEIDRGERIADFGCGYGRHLVALRNEGCTRLIGVDRSPLLLREARRLAPNADLVRGDLCALPLAAGSVSAATCFYSSFALSTRDHARAALAEIARVLRPNGRLVITTDNPLRLAGSPESSFSEEIVGLGQVEERSRFDPIEQVDVVERTLIRADGERLSGTWRIRYFDPGALAELAREAGLSLLTLEPDTPLDARTPQLIALLARGTHKP